MYAQIEKPKVNKYRKVANLVSQKHNYKKRCLGLNYNQSKDVIQRKTDYEKLIDNQFVKEWGKVSEKNPRCYWLKNKSNNNVSIPEINNWITKEKSLKNIFVNQTAGYLKPAVKNVLDNGDGVKDASAITLIIAKYKLMKGWNSPENKMVKETRTILLGTSSLNRTPPQSGQIHAEYITAATLRDKILKTTEVNDLVANGDGPVELSSIDLLSFAGKPAQAGTAITDFQPCPSCKSNLKDVFKSFKDVVGEANFNKTGLVDGTD